MGNLAFVGSHAVNGVSALHTELMKETVFTDLHRLYPDRINNKTNGITPRRWLQQCNPGADRADRATRSATRLPRRRRDAARPRAASPTTPPSSERVRRGEARRTRIALAALDRATGMGVRLDPDALFDVQIKRIHEYKRQLLNILETVALYDQIRAHPERELGAAGEDLRRQGGAELPQRQADHQAGQRRRAR